MFNSLRARLWLTYVLLVGVVLIIVGLALVAYLIRSPEEDRLAVQRLNLIAALLAQQSQAALANAPQRVDLLAGRADSLYNVRVVVLDSQGRLLVDSRAGIDAALPGTLPQEPRAGVLPIIRDSRSKAWLFATRPLQGGDTLLVAVPRPQLPIRRILQSEFSVPFRRAAILAFALALLLAVAIARWVTAPLKRMANAARQVASGEFHPIPPDGPSEVQELARAFNEMTSRVQSGQQSQRDFVANVSHELKTPLTSIQGFAQAILDGTAGTPQELQQAAGVIYAESGRMHRMVLELLDLARLDAGIADLQRVPLDMANLLGEVLEKFAPLASQAQVTLQSQIDRLPTILGDADRLSQVFTNLVDNALKYTPAGGTVALLAHLQEDQVEISVRDSGSGIPPGDLDRIFERFYQTDKSRRGGGERGLGLGLAIAREIVQAHGGAISAQNNLPRGSVFVVKLPVARPDDSTASGRKIKPEKRPAGQT